MNKVFEQNGTMCVNVLSAGQDDIAAHFAGMKSSTMQERFADPSWIEGKLLQPVNKNAISSLEGVIAKQDELGTHNLYFVKLKHIQINERDALLYFNRKFKTLNRD